MSVCTPSSYPGVSFGRSQLLNIKLKTAVASFEKDLLFKGNILMVNGRKGWRKKEKFDLNMYMQSQRFTKNLPELFKSNRKDKNGVCRKHHFCRFESV
ncbi:hypothetical protein ACROYT_G016703 [Oculina patagonica]